MRDKDIIILSRQQSIERSYTGRGLHSNLFTPYELKNSGTTSFELSSSINISISSMTAA
jgi:hypothetical protein